MRKIHHIHHSQEFRVGLNLNNQILNWRPHTIRPVGDHKRDGTIALKNDKLHKLSASGFKQAE